MQASFRVMGFVVLLIAAQAMVAQDNGEKTDSCSFSDGKQIAVHYLQPESKEKEIFGKEVPYGRPWKPSGKAIVLMTDTNLTVSGTALTAGGYRLYPVPRKDKWELNIERPTGKGESAHDEMVGTVQLDIGKLSRPLPKFTIYFGRVGDRQCNMRMYWGDTGVWAEFKEQ